ncbi:uncharacterized protein FIBRA_06079 [Fibroporia radiculosa]|uniref:CSC1/OSCA1-like 7TM region domain-containing protein n=1 Tax=Fibroporia radiculosa TaxID=599839 RepID=J4HYK0_9APHY|nr:uncharacterized protein FIBRA_06079 [Fibroporia radiculosa]CCM03927.1 predicted protein [Fibroporia radiculosa]
MSEIAQLVDEDASQRALAPAAVGTQVALMSVVSLATIIAFNILRPRNKIIYEPKVKYHVGDKKPPRISDSLFGWLPPLLHTKEPELVDKIGLDAAIYLRFLRMFRWMFTCIAFIACTVLLPADIVYNLRYVNKGQRDILSMMTIRNVQGTLLFVHVVVTYAITAIVMGFVWVNWRHVVRLRGEWFRSPEYMQSFYARTLMVSKVPRKFQSDEGIRAIFQSVQVPYPTTSVHIGRRVGQLPELIEYHNRTVRELEHVLVRYLKDGRIGKKRPEKRLGGFMCCGGQKVDAIDYYTAKLQRCEQAVEQYRSQIDLRRPEMYGFASMAAVPYAHIVANLLRDKNPKGSNITLAPNPKDILWTNLSLTKAEMARNRTLGWMFLILVCFLNTIPLFIISILANLASLTTYVTFLQDWSSASPGTFTFVSGVLPPAVSALFGYALPIIMRWLTKYMGANTHSSLDRAVIARYFAFLVISQLIIFTLIGVIFNSVTEIVQQVGKHESFKEIIQDLHTLPSTINQTYIDQSSYWLTYFPLRGFLVVFDLAQVLNLVVVFIKKRLFGRTPRDIREWTQPPDFQYSIYYSNLLFMGTVGLFFAPLAPLVAVAAMVVFWLSSLVYKYQLMFVYVSRVETGGRLWNVVINRLLASIILMQLIMVLTIGLQYTFKSLYWLSTIPPIIFVFVFKIYLNRKFLHAFRYYIPTEEELREASVHSQRADTVGNKLEKRFGHPALNAELFTPMVHANMTHLLQEVFQGKIGSTKTHLDDLGGSRVDATVVAGGVKIAGIDERDLAYDPALYQRDRGELDWDQRSMSSTTLLGDNASKANLFAAAGGRDSPDPSKRTGYDRYLAKGPQAEIEMTRMDYDQQPLLNAAQAPGYFDPNQSMASFAQYGIPAMDEAPPVPMIPAAYSQQSLNEGYREAPVHRPGPGREASWR